MTLAQPRVNTNKQLLTHHKNYFSHSLTHLLRCFPRVHTRIQMEGYPRHERSGHEASFAVLKSPFPTKQDTIEPRSTATRQSSWVNLRRIADVSG